MAILHKSIMIGSLAYDAEDGVILKCYTEETRQQFAPVIRAIIGSTLAQALATSQKQMDGWLKGALDGAIRNAQDALIAVTRDFRGKLIGAWGYLLWSVFAGGLLCGFGLLLLGYWLGKHL
jgi:citrate lyase gamma subunit